MSAAASVPDLAAVAESQEAARESTVMTNRIARLDARLARGTGSLEFDKTYGYLPSILSGLGVLPESQVLVFSKTSLQATRINPQNPRAIYFNDSVAVAVTRGAARLELSAVDTELGVAFYTVEPSTSSRPRFKRAETCLACHSTAATSGVPGIAVGSVFPNSGGVPVAGTPTLIIDHRTPMERRWGGWYVTGDHPQLRHLGNTIWQEAVTSSNGQSVTKAVPQPLETVLDIKDYLTPYSDVVALMVFEHQTHMTNLITRVQREFLGAIRSKRDLRVLDGFVAEMVDYMLFVDEAPMHGGISGTSGFAEKFSARGPKDTRGRSFYQLDLDKRIFRYPLTYMIYTETFDGLPPAAKAAIYRRISEVLTMPPTVAKYARLSADDRRAIIEILEDTKTDLPAGFGE